MKEVVAKLTKGSQVERLAPTQAWCQLAGLSNHLTYANQVVGLGRHEEGSRVGN